MTDVQLLAREDERQFVLLDIEIRETLSAIQNIQPAGTGPLVKLQKMKDFLGKFNSRWIVDMAVRKARGRSMDPDVRCRITTLVCQMIILMLNYQTRRELKEGIMEMMGDLDLAVNECCMSP
jgi:hypothetical protein